jgi:hypothetical protein
MHKAMTSKRPRRFCRRGRMWGKWVIDVFPISQRVYLITSIRLRVEAAGERRLDGIDQLRDTTRPFVRKRRENIL